MKNSAFVRLSVYYLITAWLVLSITSAISEAPDWYFATVMISVVAGLPTLLAIEWFMLKEEKVDSTGYETNLGNLRSFLRVGYQS